LTFPFEACESPYFSIPFLNGNVNEMTRVLGLRYVLEGP
jgi:hypothetical protein